MDLPPDADPFSEWAVCGETLPSASVANTEDKEVRWLPPTNMAELYDQYKHNYVVDGATFASYSVFQRAFKAEFRGTLRIRQKNQHSRCATCADLGRRRVVAATDELRTGVLEERKAHLTQVFADRNVEARLKVLSTLSVKSGGVHENSVLFLQLDGMDQASAISINVCLQLPSTLGSPRLLDAMQPVHDSTPTSSNPAAACA
jgi:hypothetical protein